MSESKGTEDSWLVRYGGVSFTLGCHLYRMLLRPTLQINMHILSTFTTGILFHYYLRRRIREIDNMETFNNSNVHLEFLHLLHIYVFWEQCAILILLESICRVQSIFISNL